MTYIITKILPTFAVLATMAASSVAIAGDFNQSKEVALPKSQLEYININPAIQMADAYGDMSKGLHGTFGKFPANFDSGVHTHTGAYHGIVVKGVMTNPFKGEDNAPRLEAGSYWYVPANSVHSTACVSDIPCEFFFFADAKFDFFPVE